MGLAMAQFRLSIWRDIEPTPPLAMQDEETGWRVITRDSGVQQEVYSWPLLSDPFGGIANDDVRKDVREALLGPLNMSLPPAERRVAALDEFVAKAEQAIEAGQTGPLPSHSASVGATAVASEPNPLLALLQHIKWLKRCFADRPGVSVSIR